MGAQTFLPLSTGARLGVLGGGQLGAYFIRAAQNLGFRTAVLCPEKDAPAMHCTDMAICADYQDEGALATFAEQCDGITTEFENVPYESLAWLAERTRVAPHAEAVKIAQHREREKTLFNQLDLNTTPFCVIHHEDDWKPLFSSINHDSNHLASTLFPAILKTATLGYDGKGQWKVGSLEEARAQWMKHGRFVGILEKQQTLIQELSVMIARGSDGSIACYPPAINVHHQGILATTLAPAPQLSSELIQGATTAATKIVNAINYVGVMGVEFFVTEQGLLINEIAPRPHNSGHYTLSACAHSQFEQQVRALAGWPLGSSQPHSQTLMINLLGDLWFNNSLSTNCEPDWQSVLADPAAALFLYGKHTPKRARKMGHINITHLFPTTETALNTLMSQARRIEVSLGITNLSQR